jgi:hypothetical protein
MIVTQKKSGVEEKIKTFHRKPTYRGIRRIKIKEIPF